MTTTYEHAKQSHQVDFVDFLVQAFRSVTALFSGPTDAEIKAAGNDLAQHIVIVASPLLLMPSDQGFREVFERTATPQWLKRLNALMDTPAAKAFIESATQKEKVSSLKPPAVPPDELSSALSDELLRYGKEIRRLVALASKRAGFRVPAKVQIQAIDAKIVVAGICVHLAAAPKMNFPQENVLRVYRTAIQNLERYALMFRVDSRALPVHKALAATAEEENPGYASDSIEPWDNSVTAKDLAERPLDHSRIELAFRRARPIDSVDDLL